MDGQRSETAQQLLQQLEEFENDGMVPLSQFLTQLTNTGVSITEAMLKLVIDKYCNPENFVNVVPAVEELFPFLGKPAQPPQPKRQKKTLTLEGSVARMLDEQLDIRKLQAFRYSLPAKAKEIAVEKIKHPFIMDYVSDYCVSNGHLIISKLEQLIEAYFCLPNSKAIELHPNKTSTMGPLIQSSFVPGAQAKSEVERRKHAILSRIYLKYHNLMAAFRTFDSNKSGSIGFHDFQEAVKNLGLNMDYGQVAAVFQSLDTNQTGRLNYDKFCHLLNETSPAKTLRSASDRATGRSDNNKSFDAISNPKHTQLNQFMSPRTMMKPLSNTRSRRTETAMTQTRQKIFGNNTTAAENMNDLLQHNFEKQWNIDVQKISHLEKPVIHMRYETKANRIRNMEIKRKMSPAASPSAWKMNRFANRAGSLTTTSINRPYKF